jgi:hypothetical protein
MYCSYYSNTRGVTLQMSDPEFVTHFSIVSMQHANEELTNIAKELPVGIELDTFNDETL